MNNTDINRLDLIKLKILINYKDLIYEKGLEQANEILDTSIEAYIYGHGIGYQKGEHYAFKSTYNYFTLDNIK